MVTAIAPEPISAGHTNVSDYRHRPASGERALLPQSAPALPRNAKTGEDRAARDERSRDNEPEAPSRDSSAIFAAAVIAGALPPRPQTLSELFQRIGSATIPPESQARLKDLTA